MSPPGRRRVRRNRGRQIRFCLAAASSSSLPPHAVSANAMMIGPAVAHRRELNVLCLPMGIRRHRTCRSSRVTLDVAMPYERDILDEFAAARQAPRYPAVDVSPGLVVEDRASGFVGDVVGWDHEAVRLRDRNSVVRNFTWKPGGFLLEGRPVTLTRPASRQEPSPPRLTNSGSIAGSGSPQVARASRIWVEGRHDAELVEHVVGRRPPRAGHRRRADARRRRPGGRRRRRSVLGRRAGWPSSSITSSPVRRRRAWRRASTIRRC